MANNFAPRASNFSATQGPFTIEKGLYAVSIVGTGGATFTGGGSVSLELMAIDGSTYVVVLDAYGNACTFTGNAETVVALPDGQVEFVVSGTVAAVYMVVAPIS